MPLEERHRWKKPRGPKWFREVIGEVFDEITAVQPIPGQDVRISQTENGRQIDGTGGGGGAGGGATDEHYEFECIDFTDADGPKILIYDGLVYGPNDDGNLPDGMTGLDDYILPLSVIGDGEIWLQINMNFDNWDVLNVSINSGYETPPDDDSNIFVTICFFRTEYTSPTRLVVTSISNAICGDYVIDPSLAVTGDLPGPGGDFEFDHVTQINFLGAVATHHDPGDVNPSAVDVDVGMYISDDDGHESELTWGIEFVGYNAQVVTSDPDPDTLGSFATVKILPDPWLDTDGQAYLTDVDGDVDWRGFWVHDDVYTGAGVSLCNNINFTHAIPDDVNMIVHNNGNGEAVVHLLKLDAIDGEGGAVSGVHQLTFLPGPPPEGEHRVQPGAIFGEALVYAPSGGGLDNVQADVGEATSVKNLFFTRAEDPSANFIEVEETSPGTVVVKIPLIPESIGGFSVLADDDGDTHWQPTQICECGANTIDGGGA